MEIKISTGAPDQPDPIVNVPDVLSGHLGDKVSISLRYFQKKAECWSEWTSKDLKSFTKTIDLLGEQTANQLRGRGASGTPKCKPHVGVPKASGFVRPQVSDDLLFYEIHTNDKARIHGFFVEEIFFLVWLDRNHRAFPSGK